MPDFAPVDRPKQAADLILYYDEYHTPLQELRKRLPSVWPLEVCFGIQRNADGQVWGADEIQRLDRRSWFADRYLSRAIKANARYQQHYNLSAALARPALAEIVAELVSEGAFRTVVHGFAGNDQLRFEAALSALCPRMAIMSVVELLGSRTRANRDGYTRSSNLWGETLEAGPLGDPSFSTGDLLLAASAARERHEVEIRFECGIPVALNGLAMPLADVICTLTEIGGEAGIAWHDLVEDGHVGLKTRALYYNPASDILSAAHGDLARLTSSRR